MRRVGPQRFVAGVVGAWLVLAAAPGSPGHAQGEPAPRPTGTVEVAFASGERAFRTFAVAIPMDVAEGVTDPAVRERLERAAGTTEHDATWNVPDTLTMGPVVLFAPTALLVEVVARAHPDREAGLGEVRLSFGLDLATLALADPADAAVSVRYYPERFALVDYYELTEGALRVDVVERVDARTLRIAGVFEGSFSLQDEVGVVAHEPEGALPVRGRFDLLEVVGSVDLDDVLRDE